MFSRLQEKIKFLIEEKNMALAEADLFDFREDEEITSMLEAEMFSEDLTNVGMNPVPDADGDGDADFDDIESLMGEYDEVDGEDFDDEDSEEFIGEFEGGNGEHEND